MRNLYALIGNPLSHSFSSQYFNTKFKQEGIDAEYKNFEISHIRDLKAVLQQHPNICGINITMPFKQSVIPLLSSLDISAQKVGAVNTIKVSSGDLIGFNTDIDGFTKLWDDNITSNVASAVILGSGGASKAIENVLQSKNIFYKTASRTPKTSSQIPYSSIWTEGYNFHAIINATPLGMHPFADNIPPIDTAKINSSHIVIDLIYNPSQTKFLQIAASQGATAINGMPMLIGQAEKAWKIWNNLI
ncbi:MAG: shikimate dehydrogenase [Bacteroidales bacterium]|nr:shikimate dehydrogenase [Bacteroidales bacterium]